MFGLARFCRVLLVFLTILIGSESISSMILEPIKSTGEEVGLIFIPGAYIKAEQYRKTGQLL